MVSLQVSLYLILFTLLNDSHLLTLITIPNQVKNQLFFFFVMLSSINYFQLMVTTDDHGVILQLILFFTRFYRYVVNCLSIRVVDDEFHLSSVSPVMFIHVFVIFLFHLFFTSCIAHFYIYLFLSSRLIFPWADDKNYNQHLSYNNLVDRINNFSYFLLNEQKDISISYMNHVRNICILYDVPSAVYIMFSLLTYYIVKILSIFSIIIFLYYLYFRTFCIIEFDFLFCL